MEEIEECRVSAEQFAARAGYVGIEQGCDYYGMVDR